MIDSTARYSLGITLIFVGVMVIVIAVILLSISGIKKEKIQGGGSIII